LSVHLRGGVDGRVARGTLRDAGTVVDDILVAVSVLAAFFLPLTSVVQILAEGKRNAAPVLVGGVAFWALFHTAALMLEATAGHAVTGRVRLQAAAQTLVVTTLAIFGAGSLFALNRAHCTGRKKKKKVRLVKVLSR